MLVLGSCSLSTQKHPCILLAQFFQEKESGFSQAVLKSSFKKSEPVSKTSEYFATSSNCSLLTCHPKSASIVLATMKFVETAMKLVEIARKLDIKVVD